jgi:hypothetical protein
MQALLMQQLVNWPAGCMCNRTVNRTTGRNKIAGIQRAPTGRVSLYTSTAVSSRRLMWQQPSVDTDNHLQVASEPYALPTQRNPSTVYILTDSYQSCTCYNAHRRLQTPPPICVAPLCVSCPVHTMPSSQPTTTATPPPLQASQAAARLPGQSQCYPLHSSFGPGKPHCQPPAVPYACFD